MGLQEFICINCPLGCSLKVETEGKKVVRVSGNTCRRGEAYAREEITNPTRTITSTAALKGGEQAVIPVKTKKPVPKDKIAACMEAIKTITVEAPVHIGDILMENVAGTGVEVVATKEIRVFPNLNNKEG